MAAGLSKWTYKVISFCVSIGFTSSLLASPFFNPSVTRLEENINEVLELENSWNARLQINQLPGESIVI